MNYTTRFAKLLGECRRQMNGAVAGSMRYYGAEYGLNYGVSLPTIRLLAEDEGQDHGYAKYLYLQQVREIHLIALHLAESEKINIEELPFWAEGIINSEVAEEAAFALFQYVDPALVELWLNSDNELIIYAALMSISKSKKSEITQIKDQIINNLSHNSILINNATITLLESYYRDEKNREIVDSILSNIPTSKAGKYILKEMSWRCESYRD